MTAGTFQVPAPHPGQLAGVIEAKIIDANGDPPPDIIKAGDSWGVQVTWHLSGLLVPLIAGTWNLRLNIEQLGGPQDFPFPEPPKPPVQVALTPAVPNYTTTIMVPGDKVTTPSTAGSTYQVLLSLGYTSPAGAPFPIGGYVNCGLVQFLG